MCLIHLDVLIVCDLKWSLFWGFLSQRRAVVILPDGTVKPAREAWLSAQHPGLHHHGHSRAEGRGDQQPRGDGGQAGWPRYRKKFFSVDRVYRYFLQIFIFASQNMIMPYMQKVSGSIPEGSTNPASGDHKPLYSQHRSWALTQICRFSLINTMYKKKKNASWSFRKLVILFCIVLLFHWGNRLQAIRWKKCSVSLFTSSRFQWTTPSEQLKRVFSRLWKRIQQMLYLEYFHQTGNGSWNLPAITQELFESLSVVVTQSSHLKQKSI